MPDCFLLGACGMNRIWAEGQRRVMDLFENTTIAVGPASPRTGPSGAVASLNIRLQGASNEP